MDFENKKLNKSIILDSCGWKKVKLDDNLKLLRITNEEVQKLSELLNESEIDVLVGLITDIYDDGVDKYKLCRDWINYQGKDGLHKDSRIKTEDRWMLTKIVNNGTDSEEKIFIDAFSKLEMALNIITSMMKNSGYAVKIAKCDSCTLVKFTNQWYLAYELEKVSILTNY